MIHVFHSYTVQAIDVSAFLATFDDGPWNRLPLNLSGHHHTGLLVCSTLPPVFLQHGIWQSEQHYLAAQGTVEFREFNRTLNLLADSHQSIGTFRYHCRQDREPIPTYSVRMPVPPLVQRACR